MKLGFLNAATNEALQIVSAEPYSNALLIADMTALEEDSKFVYARDRVRLRGLLSLYTGMSVPAIAIWCEEAKVLRRMIAKMASRYPELRGKTAWCLVGRKELDLLKQTAHIQSAREEIQMRLDLPSYIPPSRNNDGPTVVALSAESIAGLNALYEVVPPEVWRPEEINRGPYRGVYVDGRLVASAGVHWVSPWLAEIGNVAVHPDFRRRGLAEACVGAVVEELKRLTERVYLMVFADNEPAINLYRKMGFEEVQRMWLSSFRVTIGGRPARKWRPARALAIPASGLLEDVNAEE